MRFKKFLDCECIGCKDDKYSSLIENNVYRVGSEKYFEYFRELKESNINPDTEFDKELLESDIGEFAIYDAENVMKNGKYPDNGFVCCYKEGKLHREDGPAIEYVAEECSYYLNGELLWSNFYGDGPISKDIPEEVKRIMIKERLNPQLSQSSTSIMNEEL